MKNNLILGGLGFIGSNIIEYKDALPFDVSTIVLDTEKLERLIQYLLCTIEEGIQKTYEIMINNSLSVL